MKKTTRNVLIIAASIVLAIGITLAIVLPLTLTPKDTEHTVNFECNGGSEVESVKVKHNQLLSEPTAPTRAGHSFMGWFADRSLTDSWKFASDKVTKDLTLYAKWKYDATEGLNFTLNGEGNGYTLVGLGTATDADVVVPSQINNLPVTVIAANAFSGLNTITSVYVPQSVTAVKSGAFKNCANLETVTLDCNATLETEVFYDCPKLQSVTLPANLAAIPARSFRLCVSLADVQIPSTVQTIGEEAFSDCKKLPSAEFGEGLTTLETKAFAGCAALKSISLPASVRNLGENAFAGCVGMESMQVDLHNPVYFSDGNCIVYRAVGEGTTTVNTLVAGCKTSVIPSRVKIIGTGAFQGCQSLQNLSIPDSVTEIGDHAFDGCVGLQKVFIPSSVVKIGDYAFSNCSYLETVEFRFKTAEGGAEVYAIESLGREAFSHCYIKSFSIPQSVRFLGAGLFYDNQILTLTFGGNSDVWRDSVSIGKVESGEENPYVGFVNVTCKNVTITSVKGLL